MTSDISLQPDNRSALQTSLETLLDDCMATIEQDAPYRTLLFPLETPPQFLPALAIERGVLDWAPDDSDNMVRNTVAEGLLIQSRSCTRAGVQQSIAALGFNVTVTRSGPYAIHVEAALEDQPLDENTGNRIRERISTYKAERDSVSLSMLRSSRADMYVGAACCSGQIINIRQYTPEDINTTVTGSAGATSWAYQTITVRQYTPENISTTVTGAAGSASWSYQTISVSARDE